MKKYLGILLLLPLALKMEAQDIHFSQFYENSIMRNPALTGIFQYPSRHFFCLRKHGLLPTGQLAII